MQQETSGMHDSQELCIECGGARLIERVREQSFAYGPPGDQVMLTASMPVSICEDCGYESFDERGEAARHAAVCRHLGVQTPEEIRKVREGTGLTRAEFCELTGFGSASLQRWESGMVVPNASSDRMIFLLRHVENVERLRKRAIAISQGVLPFLIASADSVTSVSDGVHEIHTRCGIKRFKRFADRPRIVVQAASWSLRRSQCT
jgi:putative zinc finger/helix-turn-helix YgiT family protein